MSLQNDIKAFLDGLGKVVEGVGAVSASASAAAQRLKDAPDRIGESLDRIMEAGVNAALGAGAVALDAEMKRPLEAREAKTQVTQVTQVGPPADKTWVPAPGCAHDGTCVSPNPWTCHWDEGRVPPDGGMSVWGDTEKWFCTCGPCHVPPNQQPYVTTAAVAVKPVRGESAKPRSPAPSPRKPARKPAPAVSPIPEAGTRTTSCDKHGVLLWSGHLICQNCRRVYQTSDPRGERYAPELCLCSSNLRPQQREPFAGRSLCQGCFLGNAKHGRMA
jgi:hypothetical protein